MAGPFLPEDFTFLSLIARSAVWGLGSPPSLLGSHCATFIRSVSHSSHVSWGNSCSSKSLLLSSKSWSLCLGCTHVVLLIFSHNLNYSPFSELPVVCWHLSGSWVSKAEQYMRTVLPKLFYKGTVSLVKRHEPSTVALRAAVKAYTRFFSSSPSCPLEAFLAFRFSLTGLLNTECNKSVKYWLVSSHWLVWNLQKNPVKKFNYFFL